METKYKFEVEAKHLQTASNGESSKSKENKTKSRSDNTYPDFVTAQWQQSEFAISESYVVYRIFLALFGIFSLGSNMSSDYENGVLVYYLKHQTHLNLIFFAVVMVAGALLIMNRELHESALFMKTYDVLWHHTLTWSFCVTGTFILGLCMETSSESNIITNGIISLIFFFDLFIVKCYHRFRSFLFTFIYTVCFLTLNFLYEYFNELNMKEEQEAFDYMALFESASVAFWQALILLICLASVHHLIQFGHFIRYQLSQTFFRRRKEPTGIQML